jgi:outer membrane protein assembly factor BamB
MADNFQVRDIGRRQLLGGFGAVTLAGLATAAIAEAAGRQVPGTLLWTAQTGTAYGQELTVIFATGDLVYAATTTRLDGDAAIYAVSAATGAPAWHTQPAGPMPHAFSPEAVYGYQMTGGTGYAGGKTSVVALGAATGQVRWIYDAGDMLFSAAGGWMTYAAGKVFIAGGESNQSTPAAHAVAALDAGTGRPVWTLSTGIAQIPAVADGVVYAVDDQQVVALHATTGARIWQVRLAGNKVKDGPVGQLSATDGVVISWAFSTTCALDAATGRVIWSTDTGIPQFAAGGIAFFLDLVLPSGSSVLRAVHARTGVTAWMRDLGQNPDLNPMGVGPGTIYFGQGRTVTAVAMATGRTLWTYHLPTSAVAGIGTNRSTTVYVKDSKGTLYALRA